MCLKTRMTLATAEDIENLDLLHQRRMSSNSDDIMTMEVGLHYRDKHFYSRIGEQNNIKVAQIKHSRSGK